MAELAALLDAAARQPLDGADQTAALDAVARHIAAEPAHVVICAVSNTYIAAADVAGVDPMLMSSVLNPADVRTLVKTGCPASIIPQPIKYPVLSAQRPDPRVGRATERQR